MQENVINIETRSKLNIRERHPISSDNGLISQKLLLKSEFYYQLHVAISVAYSCLKYGVFVTTLSDAIKFVYNTVKSHGPENHVF